MQVARATLSSASNLSFSRYYRQERLPKESNEAHEERTWRERCHYDEKGQLFVPQMMLKNMLSGIASYLGIQIKGKGKRTYTRIFESGVICPFPMMLHDSNGDPLLVKDVQHEWLFVPSNGRRGGETRVEKCFPLIPQWEGEFYIQIVDETITHAVLKEHLEQAGLFMGLGRFRPSRNGIYGRFYVDGLEMLSEKETQNLFARPKKKKVAAADELPQAA